jgi:hypothetical protein
MMLKMTLSSTALTRPRTKPAIAKPLKVGFVGALACPYSRYG